MASSKTFLLLGLVFAVVVLVFSEVSARELAETTIPPIHTGGKGGAVSCNRNRPGELCHGRGEKGNKPKPGEHCKNNPSVRECYKHGGHERGGKEDPIHKRHGHEHGGEHDPNHKGHGHEKGGKLEPPNHGARCEPTNKACYGHGGHERGGEQDPIHKGHGHEHGGVVVEPIHGGKGHGHERVGEGDPRKNRPGRPGGPGTAETETKN